MNRKHVVRSILSVMLTMAMIFGTVQLPFAPESVVVHAEPTIVVSGTCGASANDGGESSVTWTLYSDGKLTISGTGAMADFDDDVPWNSEINSVKSVIIGDGVTSIGKFAFSNHSNLESVTIADSVTSIGRKAFFQCEKLTGINIHKNVSSIGESAFGNCTSLSEITVDENNNTYASVDGVLFNKDKTMLICYPKGKSGNSYSIPNTVTSIGDYAFYMCDGLTTITISDSVTSIGNHAFHFCSGLTTVDIPDSVTSIGEGAFYGCRGLTTITIPDSVTSIGDRAFENCSGLTTITIPDSVTSIGERAFYRCDGLTTITIPDSVTSIGSSAFYDCDGLTTITIPDSVTSIGEHAFDECATLQTVYAPVGLTISDLTVTKIKRYCAVKVNSTEHGTVTVSGGDVPGCGAYFTNSSANRTATLTVTPDEGYKLDSLTVKDASDNPITVENNRFAMPTNKHVTVTAEFAPKLSGSNDYTVETNEALAGTTTGTVTIKDGVTVTLSNATISGGIICEGDATIILAGNNTVTAQSFHAGIYVPENKTLTINGDGKLDVTGGYFGAGIGGYGIDYTDLHSCGNIIINSGEVTATGGNNGAGIGGGCQSDCGNITINGGTVKATGTSSGAGIGGSDNAEFGNIKITGGTVTAQGGDGAAGIGGGDCIKSRGTGGNIIITGGTVSATGNGYGTGIGCGMNGGNCRDILISGGNIEAKGGKYSVGIGSTNAANYNSICGSITITDGVESLSVTGGADANYSIGNGEEHEGHTSSCGTVIIGGVVTGYISEKEFSTKPFSISFAANGGLGDMTSKKVMMNVNDNYELPTCTFTAPTGKMFKEWSVTTGDAGAVTKAAGESVKITGDTKITATYVTIVETPVAVADLIYNGKEQTGVEAGDGYTVTGNTATNAGTYKAKATLNDGYIWRDGTTEDKVIEWSIAKATPTYEAPTGLKATTGQTLANVTLPDGWAWADKALSVGNAGTNVFKATYTPADTTNYNAVENIELTVTVTKASSGSSGSGTSNGGTTNGGSTGGNTSGGGSSAGGSDNTANKDKTTTTAPVTEKKTNPDGSVTETTKSTNADGSTSEVQKTTSADGTVSESKKTVAKDGSVTETGLTTTADGVVIQTEKTTSVDGIVKETEKTSDATGTVTEKSSVTEKDGNSVVTETVTEKDGSSSSTTVTVGTDGKAKSIVATESDGKKDSQTVSFDVKGNKATVSSIDTSTGKVTIPETIDAPDGKTYTVTKLDKDAFDGQKLKELSLPDTIKVINPKALENTGLKTLNLTGKNTKLKKNCLKNTNKNLVIKVTTKTEKRNIERQLKKAGNPKAKVKVSKKK